MPKNNNKSYWSLMKTGFQIIKRGTAHKALLLIPTQIG